MGRIHRRGRKSALIMVGSALLVSGILYMIFLDVSKNENSAEAYVAPIIEPRSKLSHEDRGSVDGNGSESRESSQRNHTGPEAVFEGANDSVSSSKRFELEEPYHVTQRFEQMGPGQIEAYLKLSTLGEGPEFLRNIKEYVTPLGASNKSEAYQPMLELLKGRFQSQFLNSVPAADEREYSIELYFNPEKTLKISLISEGKIYYETEIQNLLLGLKTGTSPDLPVNFFVELPAYVQGGYRHPLYLQLFPSATGEIIVGTLYNSNQNVDSVNYLHAEHLVFSRVP